MGVVIDPEERETREVLASAEFRGARVLEVGCGTGRLTQRYAAHAAFAAAIDDAFDCLAAAPSAGRMGRVAYVQADAPALPFGDCKFDVTLFGWSL